MKLPEQKNNAFNFKSCVRDILNDIPDLQNTQSQKLISKKNVLTILRGIMGGLFQRIAAVNFLHRA